MASASSWWKDCIVWKRASNWARTRSSDISCRPGGTSAERAAPTDRARPWTRRRPQARTSLVRACALAPYGCAGASVRLAKLEHELVHRPDRTIDREVARVLGVAQEITLRDELETGRLDLAAEHALFDAMERLSDRGAVAGPRRMVGDHQHAAGLERRVELAIHLGAVDLHIGRVVIKEKERDEVEIARVGGQRVVERPRQRDDLRHRRRLHARLEALLRARAEVDGVLGVDDAACPDRARHQLGAVAAAGSHIEHLHARAYAGEVEKLHRIAALVDLAVGVAAVGRRHDGGVVRRALRDCGGPSEGEKHNTSERAHRCTSARAATQSNHWLILLTTHCLRRYRAPTNRVIIGVQRSISLCMKRVTSAGLMALTSIAFCSIWRLTCGRSKALTTSRLALSTMSGASPAGPESEYQVVATNSAWPSSRNVGTSARYGSRCPEVVASATSRPARTGSATIDQVSMPTFT